MFSFNWFTNSQIFWLISIVFSSQDYFNIDTLLIIIEGNWLYCEMSWVLKEGRIVLMFLMAICVYIYIYIHRNCVCIDVGKCVSMCVDAYIYIYIYIFKHINMSYVYLYVAGVRMSICVYIGKIVHALYWPTFACVCWLQMCERYGRWPLLNYMCKQEVAQAQVAVTSPQQQRLIQLRCWRQQHRYNLHLSAHL